MTNLDSHPRRRRLDLVVGGAGPAGLALARSAARLGLEVTVVAPRPSEAWTNNFGCWDDELQGLEEAEAVEARWSGARIWLDDEPRTVGGEYLRLSRSVLQERMLHACRQAGVTFVDGRIMAVAHHDLGTAATLDSGAVVESPCLVDATGFRSPFVARQGNEAPAFQAAYGELVEVDGHPYRPGQMALMDYRAVSAADDDCPPTFLYAMPLDGRRIFVEETSLVARPAVSHELLRSRLAQRLDGLGIHVVRRLERERCLIPMGRPLPRLDQRTVAFGAAASLVHPATGYQIARSLQLAPAVAAALADGLGHGPARASRQAYETLWPAHRRRAWALYRFGMEFLASLDRPATLAFLEAFFDLPEPRWRGFMTGRLRPTEIYGAMAGVFRHATPPLKARLMRAGAHSAARSIARSIAPSTTPPSPRPSPAAPCPPRS